MLDSFRFEVFRPMDDALQDVCALSSLDAPGIRHTLVYANATGLVFGQIEQLDKLNINSVCRARLVLGGVGIDIEIFFEV